MREVTEVRLSMTDVHDRSRRFELIAATDADDLVELADSVLADASEFRVLQEPAPQLLLQRVRDPVEDRPFNAGEVLVTAAEVSLAGESGFAMVPGHSERGAVAGAVLDAAVAAGHDATEAIAERLAVTAREVRERRRETRAEAEATRVDFESMEGEL